MPLTKIKSLGITDGTIVNDDISASAAIASTKLSGVQGKFESQLLHVRDEKAANTAGGTFTSGAWQKRDLNTSMTNEISGASLSSSVITLPTGTYFIYAHAPVFAVDYHKLKLRNTTDGADTLIGTAQYEAAAGHNMGRSFVIGRFTIAAQKNFEIQHRCTATYDTYGFGLNGNIGGLIEVYTEVQIWKVA